MAIKTYTKGQKNQLSKNFVSTEFDCQGKGCCSSTKVDEKLITYLQQIRDHFGKSVNINSGYRCKTHNANVGGASRSNHMDGEAADIRISGVTPIEVARYAEHIGMKGIGVYSWGVHVDTRTSKYFWYDGGESNVATFGKPSNLGSIDNQPTTPVKPSGFTNSPLVNYTKISPNKTSPRNHKIDTITIHCVVGQCSVETLGNVFAPTSRQASANYGIGYDGKIGMYVEEKDRSWCTSSSSNDNRAITIEVASDTTHPYAVKDAAYKALIDLLVDICERNDIKELKWKADKSLIGQVDKQNMTAHRWFANTDCPGKYLYDHYGDIAEQVNKRLGVNISTKPEEKPTNPQPVAKDLYRVRKSWEDVKSQIGAYSILDNAKKACDIVGPNYKVFNSTGKQVHPEVEEFPYLVKVNVAVLNVRAGAGTKYKVTTQVKRNQVYTIVDEKDGWGKLKSGAGWICLDYTERCYG